MNKQSNQTLQLVGVLFIGLLLLSSCKRGSTNVTANNGKLLPGFSQPIRISSGDTDAAEPAIAASPDGSIYVAWVNHDPKNEADVMIARFNRDGQMQGSTVRVNPKPGTATAWHGDPPTIVVGPDQTVYVGWTSRVDSASGHATDLYLSSSPHHAETFGAPVKVNDDTKPAVHGMHSLAVGSDGRIYVAWLDERNITPVPMKDMKMDPSAKGHHMESNRELYFAASTDGGHTFSTNQRVAIDVCPCCKTALAINSDGRLYLSWRQVLPGDLRHIAVASSADQGKTFGAPKIVSDDQWVLAGCPVSGPALSLDTDGTLNVLWYSAGKNGETGLYKSESRNNGASFGPRVLVAAGGTRGTPVLVRSGNSFSSVWEGIGGKVIVRSLTSDTQPRNSEFVVASGEVPAAVPIEKRLFIAYIFKQDERQNVWLTSTQQ